MYSAIFPGLIDLALVALFSAIRQKQVFAAVLESAAFRDAIKASIAASLWALLLFAHLLFGLWPATRETRAAQFWDGPGKVLLFPCQIFHSRLFPRKHSFLYSYLAVGIPVGFEGTAGGMVSVGARGKGKGKQGLLSCFFPAAARGWFTVDPADYLERGRPELGLRGKLDEYLRAQVSYWRGGRGQERNHC